MEDYIEMYFRDGVCPKCGKPTYRAITGKFTLMGHYLVQRHCDNCHYTDVTNHMTGKKRDGTLE